MQTSLTQSFLESVTGQQADSILRNCVHCGFCNATCPTYQLTGDELDGPRGRIYLIKQILEGNEPSANTQLHLDRCLTCRNCETTCPSGVQYSQLLDTGRQLTEKIVKRPLSQRLFRTALRKFLLSPLFGLAIKSGRLVRPLMPNTIKQLIPIKNPLPSVSNNKHEMKILLVEGCVQKSLQPSIDAFAINVFNALDITTVKTQSSGCCGALNHHLSAENAALKQIRTNIDTWLPLVESGEVKAITMTASGCGVMIRDYQHILQNDTSYAEKAKRISNAYLDPIEIVQKYNNNNLQSKVKKTHRISPALHLTTWTEDYWADRIIIAHLRT